MHRVEPQSIGSLTSAFLRENGLEKLYFEKRLVSVWPEVIGATAARYTRDPEIRDGVLYVKVTSAALRQELFNCRFRLVEKLHQAIGATDVIRDIRLL